MRCLAVALASTLLWTGAAGAQPRPDREETARTRFAEGQAAYQAGDFPRAAEAFLAAYRAVASPEIAFNIAKVHERMGDLDVAIRYYELYLRRAEIEESEAAHVRDVVDRLKAEKRRRSQAVQPVAASQNELDAEARTFFDRGMRMFRRRDYAGALQAFQAALSFARQARNPVPELFFNMAATLERLGRAPEAAGFYDNYLRQHRELSDRERDEIRRKIETLCGDAPRCP